MHASSVRTPYTLRLPFGFENSNRSAALLSRIDSCISISSRVLSKLEDRGDYLSMSCGDVLQSLPESCTPPLLYIHHATSHAAPRLLRGIRRTDMQASGININRRLFSGDPAARLRCRYRLSRPPYFNRFHLHQLARMSFAEITLHATQVQRSPCFSWTVPYTMCITGSASAWWWRVGFARPFCLDVSLKF